MPKPKHPDAVIAVAVAVLLAGVCVFAQNLYTLQWDQNTDQPTGYRVYDNGTKVGEVPDSPLPSFQVTLPVDDYTLHTYGVTAYLGTVESAPGTVTLQQPAPTPTPSPEPAPDPTPQPPAPTPAFPESSDGTLLPPATQLVDSSGVPYTLSTSSMVLKNGDVIGGPAIALRYRAHGIEADAAGNWWRYIDGGWTNVGASVPIPVPIPTPIPVPIPSPVPTWKCTIPATVTSYANGDDKVTLRCPKAFPGIKGNSVTVTVP